MNTRYAGIMLLTACVMLALVIYSPMASKMDKANPKARANWRCTLNLETSRNELMEYARRNDGLKLADCSRSRFDWLDLLGENSPASAGDRYCPNDNDRSTPSTYRINCDLSAKNYRELLREDDAILLEEKASFHDGRKMAITVGGMIRLLH